MIEPYYQDDACTIYHGDCRAILPQLDVQVDMVFVDPPYGLNYNNGDLAHHWEKAFAGAKHVHEARPITQDSPGEADKLLRDVLPILRNKILKRGACCCCCCCGGGPRPLFAEWTLLLDQEIGFKQAVVWDKPGLGMGIHFRRSYELILIAQNGTPAHRWNGGNTTSNIWRLPKIIPDASQHPTEKPLAIPGRCIELFSHPGDIVLDFCLGSGTTLRAAKDLGRRAIGIEIEEKYCEIAARRLSQEVLPLWA